MADMLKRVRFTREASEEFMASVEWYESVAKGLGLGFTSEIENTIEKTRLHPDFYRRVTEDIRKIQLNRFPYSIFYTVENDVLVILRVFHNKRKPVQW